MTKKMDPDFHQDDKQERMTKKTGRQCFMVIPSDVKCPRGGIGPPATLERSDNGQVDALVHPALKLLQFNFTSWDGGTGRRTSFRS